MTGLRWGLIGASTIAAEHMIEAFRANGGQAVVRHEHERRAGVELREEARRRACDRRA